MSEMEYKETGVTLDTHHPCFELRKGESYAVGCYTATKILIWLITSKEKGDMKAMLTFLVKKIGTNKIMFTSAIGESLYAKLKGFKYREMLHPQMGEKIPVLEGRWRVRS